MSHLKGFCLPLSPKGKAQLVGKLPWHFSMDVMAFIFRTDPDEVKKLLPDPYEPSSKPDIAYVWFMDTLSVCEEDKDMIYVNPERTMYRECLLGVRCRMKGIEGHRVAYMWADNDFTLLRGWFYGYPKKLGRIHMSSSKRQIYELNRGISKFGTGTRLQGFLEAHGDRLITGNMKLGKQITPADLMPPLGLPTFNILHYPNTEIGSDKPLVFQIIQPISEPPTWGDVWAAEEASLTFNESEIEEHTAIKPREIISAYFLSMGLSFQGVKVLHQY